MESGNINIKNVDLKKQMKDSYLDYAMSVIVSRALPDIRDGLKPVHRRIIYGMSELSLTPDKSYRKSARLVGDVLGKYHPHGDTAVYEAMVRLAQDFSTRYLLVDGQGNFGSIDGDGAAAMRYTEVRMTKLTLEMLRDISKNTVDFKLNFDESEKEPVVLPSRFPNLLVNGSSGIAVGMATNMPPHNIEEVIDGVIKYIDNPDIEMEDLIKIIKGPDFPTGGMIMIPSSMEHKKAKGIRYKTGFSTKAVAKWDTPAVNRILTNEIYIGTLQQGKREKINYKLDKVVSKDRSDWIEIEDNHEAIIDIYDFEIAQKLLKCDIKAKNVGEKADLFSGLLFCKDCNAQMTKKVDKRGKTPTIYYICSQYNKGKECSRHSIKQEELKLSVLEMIRHYINSLGKYESISEEIREMEVSYELFQKIDKRQEYTKKSKVKFELLKSALYQDLKEGIISEEEFYDMREFYTNRIVESELILEKQNKEISRLYQKSLGNKNFLSDIKKYRNISTLERGLLVRLVDKIYVLEEKRIEIHFNYDETTDILDKLSDYTKQSSELMKEVV